MRRRKPGKQLALPFMRARRPVQKIQRAPFEVKGAKIYFYKGEPYLEKVRRHRVFKKGRNAATVFEFLDKENQPIAHTAVISQIPRKTMESQMMADKRKEKRLFVPKSAFLYFDARRGGLEGWLKTYEAGIFDALFKSAINHARENGVRRIIAPYGGSGDYIVQSEMGAKIAEKIGHIFRRFGFKKAGIEMENYWYKDLAGK